MLPKIDAVILAAGKSERFGQPKVLHSFLGEPFVSRIIDGMRQAGVRNVSLVLGHKAGEYIRRIPQSGFPYIVINKNYALGQFSSLQAGIKSINQDATGVLMTLVDYPHITQETYQAIVDKASGQPDRIIIPVHNTKGGHPVYLPNWLFPRILKASPEDNLRNLFTSHSSAIHRFEVPEQGITMDIDTSDDLERIERIYAQRMNGNS